MPQNATQTFEELVIIRDGQRVHPGCVFYRLRHRRFECIFEANGETNRFGLSNAKGEPGEPMQQAI